ncbi:glycosyltransferase [Myxococcota bacterium]|nr:glycosyltransferase [Myxococcota bacterium]
MATALVTVYAVVLGALALLGIYRLHLTWIAVRALRRRGAGDAAGASRDARDASDVPTVVVQLPLYNEALVAERLVRAAARLRWPAGRLRIQVLDDSTDGTRAIVGKVAKDLAAEGIDVEVLRRPSRRGYKAGALAYGLEHTDAEVVAIFDADFIPAPDFLERMVPVLLADPRCAMAQARWGHLNRETSYLTRAQAIFLDGHFAVEHEARSASGRFFNFNGTAGVWRRAAIEDAGGWGFDTITEDLELSYRVQLAGWRFAYVGDVVAPAELPESWPAFRSQQSRWVRGSIETARRHLANVLRARTLPLAQRIDGAIHLTHNLAYVLMALLAVLLPATVIVRSELAWAVPGGRLVLGALDAATLAAGTGAMVVFYLAASITVEGRFVPARLVDLAYALCLGAGMSLSNAREVLAGLVVRTSEFIRTPKRGDAPLAVALVVYRSRSPVFAAALELAFAAYFLGAIVYALRWSLFASLPFLALYLVGFVSVGGGELAELWRRRVGARAEELAGVELPPAA